MKLLSTCLLAAAFVTFLSGCVTETESYRSVPGDERMQHSKYDTPRERR
jgi:3-methyladenine DNA glycosylase Mpg